jgi:hypothetical protein
MNERTVKGAVFTIVVEGKRIVVKHVSGKGKRCRVIAPAGVSIEEHRGTANQQQTDTRTRLP